MHTKSLTKCLTLTMSTTRGCMDGALPIPSALRCQFATATQQGQLSGWIWQKQKRCVADEGWSVRVADEATHEVSELGDLFWQSYVERTVGGQEKGRKRCVRARSMFVSWESGGCEVWLQYYLLTDPDLKLNKLWFFLKPLDETDMKSDRFDIWYLTCAIKKRFWFWTVLEHWHCRCQCWIPVVGHFACQRCHFGCVREALGSWLDLLLPWHRISSAWLISWVRLLVSAFACPVRSPWFLRIWMCFLAIWCI